MSEKTKKILLGIAAVAVVTVLSAFIVVVVINNSPVTAEPESSEGERIGDKQDKFMVLSNLDIITMAYNIKISTMVAEDIEDYIFLPEQMRFSGENNPDAKDGKVYYDAVLDVKSFSSLDMYTSGFKVTISDGREYHVIMQTDSMEEDFSYLYVAIMLKDSDEFGLYVNGDEKDKDRFIKFVETETSAHKGIEEAKNE